MSRAGSLVAPGGIGDNTAPPTRPRRPIAHEPDLGAPRRRRQHGGGRARAGRRGAAPVNPLARIMTAAAALATASNSFRGPAEAPPPGLLAQGPPVHRQ